MRERGRVRGKAKADEHAAQMTIGPGLGQLAQGFFPGLPLLAGVMSQLTGPVISES